VNTWQKFNHNHKNVKVMYVAFWRIVVLFQVWQKLDFFKNVDLKKIKVLSCFFFKNYFLLNQIFIGSLNYFNIFSFATKHLFMSSIQHLLWA
jgi:hypothetical protein